MISLFGYCKLDSESGVREKAPKPCISETGSDGDATVIVTNNKSEDGTGAEGILFRDSFPD
jgi:hypothetical protein